MALTATKSVAINTYTINFTKEVGITDVMVMRVFLGIVCPALVMRVSPNIYQ